MKKNVTRRVRRQRRLRQIRLEAVADLTEICAHRHKLQIYNAPYTWYGCTWASYCIVRSIVKTLRADRDNDVSRVLRRAQSGWLPANIYRGLYGQAPRCWHGGDRGGAFVARTSRLALLPATP